jgi:hypothetical protein
VIEVDLEGVFQCRPDLLLNCFDGLFVIHTVKILQNSILRG